MYRYSELEVTKRSGKKNLRNKIRYALLSHKEKVLQGVLKHTHIIQNVNTQMRIKIWTVYIKTNHHSKMEYCYKIVLKIRFVLDI